MKEKLDQTHPDYDKALSRWEFISDAIDGEQAIKARGETYLPKTPGMLSQDAQCNIIGLRDAGEGLALKKASNTRYDNYKMRAEFPEKVSPACDAAVGFFTDKDAAVEFPAQWEPVLESATPEADTVWDLHRIVSGMVVQKGRCALWADVHGDGDLKGLPYWVAYKAEEVINWSEAVIGGQRVLDRIVFKTVDLENGEEVKTLTRATLTETGVMVERWRKAKDDDDWRPVDVQQPRSARSDMGEMVKNEDGTVAGFRLRRIPVQFINADSLRPQVGKIPFLPLAAQCLKVYRMDANYQEALSFYEPTPFISGLTEEWIDGGHAPTSFGAGAIWYGPAGSDAKMLEYTGPSIENQRVAIQDAMQRADELSMKPFEPKLVSVESGDAKKQRTKTQTSAAKVMAQHVGSGIQKIMRVSGEWLGQDPEKIIFEPSYDFIEAVMDWQTAQTLFAIQQAGGISARSLHENYQRGGITEKSFEEERELIGKGE